tara:strand:+ start:633 stop:992 length:360 start_codon:yes stop_codon:yes gene_type:complete
MNNFLLKSILAATSIVLIITNQNLDKEIDNYIDCKIKETINGLKNVKIKKQDYDKILYLKKQAYNILIDTMKKTLDKNKNISFREFLKSEWKSDYKMYIKKERDYREWSELFTLVKQYY